ncbi:uncharacterized zinc finger CCHC domain-containing protein At4g19190 [Camellia sinensis]|uniref:CBF1-interacting co-repressor CIR N-terminal domain-containing protein n=1 Tax=Camellia sinensis var. sinensis TaxID=542762 RepID=A0A4S4E3M5_CAMSN|nr:uncharacterized zinc finger CCHC domain-containing protein At4g19190 [Camellia sinensis]THG10521.1 hypothetical protein TEA_004150 [Camellia sinensis var. sinensis]
MEEEEGGLRLSKRFSDKGGEVDFKTKSGTAWSHSYLNQKPWHPLSYPNQRRKWIAEQTHVQRERRAEEVAREFAHEQEFFRQAALVSKKEKEKMEMMKAVSFMYVRPPGYNPESAQAAEIADERKNQEQSNPQKDPSVGGASTSMPLEGMPGRDRPRDEKKKPKPKDVFGRALPTEEQFEILKNAPRMETGAPARVKPFGVEVRNVKCLRCGNFGHQSGDRECPLKDAIMPNEESRLKRDDPLTAMMAHTDSSEPLKWELKQKPGMSPPRGGFNPDDPNQQIVAEDIFDEYGGFLSGENIPELLANFSSSKPKKKSTSKKHSRRSSPTCTESKDHKEYGSFNDDDDERKRSKMRKRKMKRHKHSESSPSDEAEFDRHDGSSEDDDDDERKRSKKGKDKRKKHKHSESSSSDDAEFDRHRKRSRHRHSYSSLSEDSGSDERRRSKHRHRSRHRHRR